MAFNTSSAAKRERGARWGTNIGWLEFWYLSGRRSNDRLSRMHIEDVKETSSSPVREENQAVGTPSIANYHWKECL